MHQPRQCIIDYKALQAEMQSLLILPQPLELMNLKNASIALFVSQKLYNGSRDWKTRLLQILQQIIDLLSPVIVRVQESKKVRMDLDVKPTFVPLMFCFAE